MSTLRILYLLLAVWGAVHPMWHVLSWLTANGFDMQGLFAAWTANDAVTGLSMDLVIAVIALVLWILAEVSVRRNWSSLWAVPATCLIGVGCGLPLYLFLRTRPV
ncbi:hypothetical protein OB2597_09699 [Pseudooceanicola batsensis HTCC2597]|uniref:K+-transporting ATPase, A chain n=1 Tax=Pseudooceanicola batsensis (strain ATCC BAA-863 / DSM 15984 / KCTC 12145 / HTCC2597) TaxID=252305 RepID=A3TV62_PSEBH|nr:DUF2834 domain-containing protein [Pseudooceanicola batsensis]EAQ04408.1 hypothetical protein OB2597_09699 [Pseudooceanicola batsensis HTCC2597]